MTTIPTDEPGWRLYASTTAGHSVLLAAGLERAEAEQQLAEIADLLDGRGTNRRTLCTDLAVVARDSIEAVRLSHYRTMYSRARERATR